MAGTVLRKRFTVDDYYRMAEAGILSEQDRVELIDGEVVAMTPEGPRHGASVSRAVHTLISALGQHAIVRPGNPVRLN
jgi:Uma2 family endonuclease